MSQFLKKHKNYIEQSTWNELYTMIDACISIFFDRRYMLIYLCLISRETFFCSSFYCASEIFDAIGSTEFDNTVIFHHLCDYWRKGGTISFYV